VFFKGVGSGGKLWEFELRASHFLGRHSTSWVTLPVLFCVRYFLLPFLPFLSFPSFFPLLPSFLTFFPFFSFLSFFPFLSFFLSVLGLELGAYTLRYSTSPFCHGFFQDILWTICLGWLQTVILLISASWISRIAGVSHQCPACVGYFWGKFSWTVCWG
jgi:hypothetical protein